jgi:hypothetical protein
MKRLLGVPDLNPPTTSEGVELNIPKYNQFPAIYGVYLQVQGVVGHPVLTIGPLTRSSRVDTSTKRHDAPGYEQYSWRDRKSNHANAWFDLIELAKSTTANPKYHGPRTNFSQLTNFGIFGRKSHMRWRNSHNPYHPDVALFLVAIPFISAFNYYLTYSNIRLSWFLLMTFAIDTAQGYAAWLAVRSIILYLDKKWPYGDKPYYRIVFQLIITTIAGLAIISALTELVSFIAKGKSAPLSFYTFDLFIISIWFFVINGIYVGLYYYNTWRNWRAAQENENRKRSEGLIVRHGNQDLKISFDELAGFYVDGEYVVASHLKGRKYYLDQSLDKTEKNLPFDIFFRVNRQYILNRQMISGFRRMENGKLQVMLHPREGFPQEIPVSRIKAVAFKSWFQSH